MWWFLGSWCCTSTIASSSISIELDLLWMSSPSAVLWAGRVLPLDPFPLSLFGVESVIFMSKWELLLGLVPLMISKRTFDKEHSIKNQNYWFGNGNLGKITFKRSYLLLSYYTVFLQNENLSQKLNKTKPVRHAIKWENIWRFVVCWKHSCRSKARNISLKKSL